MEAGEGKYCKCLYFTANALARKTEKLAQQSWKKVGLSPSHAYLLMIVLDKPGEQPGAMATELQLTPSTITRLIEKLEKKKMVIRTTTGKIANVYPTPKAKELLPVLKSCLQEFYTSYCDILGRDESTKLVQEMSIVANKLKV